MATKRIQGRKGLSEQRQDGGKAQASATRSRAPRVAATTKAEPRTPIDRPAPAQERRRPRIEPLVVRDNTTGIEREMPLAAYNLLRNETMPLNGRRSQPRYTVVSGNAGDGGND